ncbi:MAG: Asp-tRNA(Asn)/Glu-tRNA(Gln) amidotransferase subunit GatA [Patescibacteria group bacterium]
MKELHKLTITEAIEGLKNADFSSVELVEACFKRIEQVDDDIKAFVTLTKDLALEKAKSADEGLKKKGVKVFEERPLLGIPYACKDNFSTKGIKTTASSNVLKEYIPPFESTVTRRLNEAGAILLGKTNMDAFAHGSSTETSDFFKTKNPWDLNKVPGGSSGGSAAAVASDMCIFAMGSETAGSVRGPASWCGTTGLKPSYGRVSRYGVVAMASSTDSPGPLTKSVDDAALVLSVIAGKDPLDATSSPERTSNYLSEIQKFNLKGLKIGKPKSYFDLDLEYGVRQRVEEACDVFEKLGAEIVGMDLLSPKYSIAVYTILQRSEVSSNLARLDGIRYGNDRSNFGFEAKKRIMLGTYALSSGYYDAYYAKAQKVRTLVIDDFNKAFEKVDLLIAPSMPCVALDLGESEKSSMFGELMDVLTEPSSIAGICGISIPVGIADNMPVGAMLMANMHEEEKILGAAKVFQSSTDFHLERPNLK